MTAPRRSARPAPPGRTPPRPSSITLALISLSLSIALPLGTLAAADRFDTDEAALAASFGMVLLATLLFIVATRRRAGIPIRRGGLALPALVSAGLIVATYAAIVYFQDDWPALANDFVDAAAVLPLGLMAAATFFIIYTTLSMARR